MKLSLPTLHEIIEQQKQLMHSETSVPAAASVNINYATGNQETQTVQDLAPAKVQQEETASIFYSEFSLSTNNVIKAAWEKALLQYFKTKISNK